jgi:hypothetical protein
MNKNNKKANFSQISLFSESQDYPFINSSAFRDYDLLIKLYHYDDVTFKLKFTNEEKMQMFMNCLYYEGFTLTTKGLSLELKSDTDVNKRAPTIVISGDTTSNDKFKPADLRELYNIFSKQFKKQVKRELATTKKDERVWHDDIGQTYYFGK